MTQPARIAGHALVEALIAQGIDTCFGVPGESFLAENVKAGNIVEQKNCLMIPTAWSPPIPKAKIIP